MQRKRISLCMIVKDEEHHLPRCLASVKGAVDEVVIVDTGSRDRTIRIARQFGARVVEMPWRGDFAAARNAGIEQASGDWILFLDADEELDREGRDQLKQYVQHEQYDGFFLQIHNYVGSGTQGATINPVLRLFRNKPYHRFEGTIHEQIAAAICRHKPDAAFHITDTIIHHYGYRHEDVVGKDKIRRNIGLLEQAIAAEPDNAFYRYNLGVEHLRKNDASSALLSFEEAKRQIDPLETSYSHLLYKYEIRCYQTLGRWEEALAKIDLALELFPAYTDLLQYKAVSYEALGRREAAVRSLLEAIRVGPPPAAYHTEEGMGTYQTAFLLGQLMEEAGETEEALEWYMETVRFKSSLTPPLYRMFHMLRRAGQEERIVALLQERLAVRSPEALWKVVAILLQCRCSRAAVSLLDSREGRQLPEVSRRHAAAQSYMLSGRWEEARSVLEAKHGRGQEKKLEELRVQLDWLEGRKIRGKDPVVALLTAAAGSDTNREERPKSKGDGSRSRSGNGTSSASGTSKPSKGGSGSQKAGQLPQEDHALWPDLQRLLLAADAANRKDALGYIVERWVDLIRRENNEGRAAGADALVKGLAAVADRHLALLGNGGRMGLTSKRAENDEHRGTTGGSADGPTYGPTYGPAGGSVDDEGEGKGTQSGSGAIAREYPTLYMAKEQAYRAFTAGARLKLPCEDGF